MKSSAGLLNQKREDRSELSEEKRADKRGGEEKMSERTMRGTESLQVQPLSARQREDLSYVICDFIQPPYQMIVWEKKKPF